jgi:hypothetical protein
VPLKVIRDEYERGSRQVLKKLDWLQEKGWDQVWRARGDGDCFYRCERRRMGSPTKVLMSPYVSIPS